MNFNKQLYSIEEIKKIDMVTYLSQLGYEPAKIQNADHWYLSPLRTEHTPSFKINRKLNKWYDHGMGMGGNIIDFGILYNHCTVSELINRMNAEFSFHQPIIITPNQNEREHKIVILQESMLSATALTKYLKQREIPDEIADRFCKEVRYQLNGKIYYGIGFKNDSGGYEIRNPYFKTSSAPKDITTFNNAAKQVAVFEGSWTSFPS